MKTETETETYELPAFWASALINHDWTGLEDEDAEALLLWLEDVAPDYCIDVSDEPFFTKWHDAQKYALACDCLVYTFQFLEEV